MKTDKKPKVQLETGSLELALASLTHGDQFAEHYEEIAPRGNSTLQGALGLQDTEWVELQMGRLVSIIRDETDHYSSDEKLTAIHIHSMIRANCPWPSNPWASSTST